jgi:methyl-accepting chemotaxis protein
MLDRNRVQKIALKFTRFIGSPGSIVVHTLLFAGSFLAVITGWLHLDRMLLVLTTIVSLEAIYLAIFIQMTINLTTESIEEVSEDIEEMQEDIGELQEDVEEISEDVEDISEDVEEMVVEEETEEVAEEVRKQEQRKTLTDIQSDLRKLMEDIDKLQKNQTPRI